MKKNILIFGLLSGLIVSSMLAIAITCYLKNDFEGSMILGFTVMILAFSFIFVGIKNYRDKFNEGVITFGKAFKIGVLISLIASTMYVISWIIIYYNFVPDFMEKMSAYSIDKIKLDKELTSAEMSKKIADVNQMKEAYKNPIIVVLYTYLEIFPVGLIVTLLSALILKRKQINQVNVA